MAPPSLRQQAFIVREHPLLWEMVPFDVQLIGGYALHRGQIAEMATGEGKTLVATLPVYLNALTGRGVHVVTVNDYLARRDSEWMGAVYKFVGLTVGCILHDQPPSVRREQYNCDITYGTNAEFGFDYLRDNGMAARKEEQVQRGHYFAIVDEVDSILIDEARTPLIISGPAAVPLINTPGFGPRSRARSHAGTGSAIGFPPKPRKPTKLAGRMNRAAHLFSREGRPATQQGALEAAGRSGESPR